MNEDERMSDTLSKWERICKGSSVREMKLVFKVSLVHCFQRESLPYWLAMSVLEWHDVVFHFF